MLVVKKLSKQSKEAFSVIIATRNRRQLLENILSDIAKNSLVPFLVIIIDSTDEYERITNNYPFQLIHLYTDQKSAAIQRNIAIEILEERDLCGEFVTILDDDVRIPEDFFRSIIDTFNDYPAAIGVSGITEESAQFKNYQLLRNFLGLSGIPGQLTRAAVNISPAGIEKCRSVDWLIGCSSWRSEIFRMLKYEPDFQGQSLFEDVIFSARARKYGSLIVNPAIELSHKHSEIGRPEMAEHYKMWVINRYRIFKYHVPNVYISAYWLANASLLALYSMKSLSRDEKARSKARGILKGMQEVCIRRLSQ